MDKKKFLEIRDSTLKEIGFVKKRGAYYLGNNSDLAGAIFLHKSYHGAVYYVECTITIQGYNETFPFPRYYDTDLSTRFQFPLKVRLPYNPSATLGYSVDLELNTEEEIIDYLEKGVTEWLLPALQAGKQYILDNWDKYYFDHMSEKVHAALLEWKKTGIMPNKQI